MLRHDRSVCMAAACMSPSVLTEKDLDVLVTQRWTKQWDRWILKWGKKVLNIVWVRTTSSPCEGWFLLTAVVPGVGELQNNMQQSFFSLLTMSPHKDGGGIPLTYRMLDCIAERVGTKHSSPKATEGLAVWRSLWRHVLHKSQVSLPDALRKNQCSIRARLWERERKKALVHLRNPLQLLCDRHHFVSVGLCDSH